MTSVVNMNDKNHEKMRSIENTNDRDHENMMSIENMNDKNHENMTSVVNTNDRNQQNMTILGSARDRNHEQENGDDKGVNNKGVNNDNVEMNGIDIGVAVDVEDFDDISDLEWHPHTRVLLSRSGNVLLYERKESGGHERVVPQPIPISATNAWKVMLVSNLQRGGFAVVPYGAEQLTNVREFVVKESCVSCNDSDNDGHTNEVISLPPTFSKKLSVLNLAHCRLKSVPNAWSLDELVHCNMRHNCVSEWPAFALGSNLRTLDLSYNSISVVPDQIGTHCTQLLSLCISHNMIEKLPPSLVDCKLLRNLDVSHNPLLSLPHNLSDLSSLVKLVVDATDISHIRSLPSSLQELYCANNRSLMSVSFLLCSSMHTVDMTNCYNFNVSLIFLLGVASLPSSCYLRMIGTALNRNVYCGPFAKRLCKVVNVEVQQISQMHSSDMPVCPITLKRVRKSRRVTSKCGHVYSVDGVRWWLGSVPSNVDCHCPVFQCGRLVDRGWLLRQAPKRNRESSSPNRNGKRLCVRSSSPPIQSTINLLNSETELSSDHEDDDIQLDEESHDGDNSASSSLTASVKMWSSSGSASDEERTVDPIAYEDQKHIYEGNTEMSHDDRKQPTVAPNPHDVATWRPESPQLPAGVADDGVMQETENEDHHQIANGVTPSAEGSVNKPNRGYIGN